MSAFLKTSEYVVQILRDNSFAPEADELAELIDNYSKNGNNATKKQVAEMCHIKWLGDLNILTIPSNDWLTLLDKLKRI